MDGDSRDRRSVRCGAGDYQMRPAPQSPANADTFTVWSVSLTSHVVAPLLKGVNLRWLEGCALHGRPLEPAILYDNCRDCSAQTYFTAFYYDLSHHMWAARWLRGSDAAPVWGASPPAGVSWTQVCTRWPIPTDGNWWAPGTTLLRKPKAARGLCLPLRSGPLERPGADSAADRTGRILHGAAAVRFHERRSGPDAWPGLVALPADRSAQFHAQAGDHSAGQQPRPVRASRRAALGPNLEMVKSERSVPFRSA